MSNVAKTILDQLGGGRFAAMTGARDFLALPNTLAFSLPGAGGFCKDGINRVKIMLMPSDTYKVEFIRQRRDKRVVVSSYEDVYFDMLRTVFERATGLRTSL